MKCAVLTLAFFVFALQPAPAAEKLALASPSPAPAKPRLRTSAYVRAYDASLLTASALPGGINQTDEVGTNLFAILHADYYLGTSGWFAGASYYYVTPSPLVQPTHTSTFLETYAGYKADRFSAKVGNQFFRSPWADTHSVLGLSPTAFQGADITYAPNAWSFEIADMVRFESRTAGSFQRTTLLSDTPASGFTYARASYAPRTAAFALNGYAYSIDNLANIVWLSGAASLSSKGWSPSIAAQGGVENNAGASYIGKIHSSVFGLQVSVSPFKSIGVSAGFDTTPWHRDTIVLPKGVSCDSGGATPTYQLSTQTALPYFLPQGVAQCLSHSDGSTSVYYGGWATPYSDSYATDPLFTTGFAEGAPDRRSPGNSSIVDGTYTSGNGRLTLFSSYTRHDYSNAIARQETTEWGTLAGYRFNEVRSGAYYKGLLLRCFYVVQRKSNVAYASGASYLGSLPLIRYSRIQLEYTL